MSRPRVFPDRDQLQSWWLPVILPKTQNDKAYWIPDVGEQVVCLMDAHDEDGAVVGAIYSAADSPPANSPDVFHLSTKDNASFEYNRASHALQVTIPTGGTVTISANGAQIAIDSAGDVQTHHAWTDPARKRRDSKGWLGWAIP